MHCNLAHCTLTQNTDILVMATVAIANTQMEAVK